MNKKKSFFSHIFKVFLDEDKKEQLCLSRAHSVQQIQGPFGRRADADSHIALRMSDMQDFRNKE
ncbi:MAG: hypothetical protein VW378_06320 [bacterium]